MRFLATLLNSAQELLTFGNHGHIPATLKTDIPLTLKSYSEI